MEINWQDADSSSSKAVLEIFPRANVMICGGHAARAHLKQLERLATQKQFSKSMQDRNKEAFPEVVSVKCHCSGNHSPGCGCMSKAFMEQSRNNFSQILTGSESASEFSRRMRALPHHVSDIHEWDGGECEFHLCAVVGHVKSVPSTNVLASHTDHETY